MSIGAISASSGITLRLLSADAGRAARAAHQQRADRLLAAHRGRRMRGERHPVEDFLFTYYSFTPAQLRRWHAGVGTGLIVDGDEPVPRDHTADRWLPNGSNGAASSCRVLSLDVAAFLARRGDAVRHVRRLLEATASRPAQLGCLGLHEWAMVYQIPADDVRHAAWPLRLGSSGTDAVVESHRLRCSHFDAFRFFTDAAVPRNELAPTRATQVTLDQPGCLHATMDLYKWAYKLSPATPSSLVLDCFELARDVRTLDMRASPYDLRALGYQPVPIETADGKTEYVAAQRAFAERAAPLRAALVDVCDRLLRG